MAVRLASFAIPHAPAVPTRASGRASCRRHASQAAALDRRRDGAADQTIQPVVVAGAGAELPFVHGAPTSLHGHRVLGRCVLGKEPVPPSLLAEERQATAIAQRDAQPGVYERLPVVGVEDNVADTTLAVRGGDYPPRPRRGSIAGSDGRR